MTICFFMTNESVTFKDVQGISDDAKYLGPTEHENCIINKIIRSDGKEYRVDGAHLLPIDEPDIASVPITAE